jgi:hypothetical protein
MVTTRSGVRWLMLNSSHCIGNMYRIKSMHKLNTSFVLHFYILRSTSWIWTNPSTDAMKFEIEPFKMKLVRGLQSWTLHHPVSGSGVVLTLPTDHQCMQWELKLNNTISTTFLFHGNPHLSWRNPRIARLRLQSPSLLSEMMHGMQFFRTCAALLCSMPHNKTWREFLGLALCEPFRSWCLQSHLG